MTHEQARSAVGADPAPRWLFPALAVAAASVVLYRYVTILSWAWPMKLDDAFIAFRYARNLVEGVGLVWNPGEPPVEGYSNFLWVLVMAVVHQLGLEPLRAAKVLGLLSSVLGLGAVGWLTWRATACRYTALAAALLLGFTQDWIVNAVLGLETSLYATLMMLALGSVLQLAQSRTPRLGGLAGVLLGVCALTRPEAPMLFLLSGAWLGWQWRGAVPRRAALVFAAGFGAVFGPYFVFRLAYYGDFLPTAVRAKDAGQPFVQSYLAANPFLGGPEYVVDLLRAYSPVVVLAAAGAVLVTREVGSRLALPGLVVAGYFAGVARTWPVMGLAHRLLMPAAVLLMVLAAPAVIAFVRRARTPLAAGLGLAVALLGVRFLSAEDTPPFCDDLHGSGRTFMTRYLERLDHLHVPLANTLATFPPSRWRSPTAASSRTRRDRRRSTCSG